MIIGTKRIAVAAGLAVMMAASAAGAMDVSQVKAKATPETGSTQWAEVCAASFMGTAYLAPQGSDEQSGALTLGKAWVQLAISANGKTYDDYVDNQLTGDMQSLYDAGDDVVAFYKQYCAAESQKMLNS